VKDLLRSQSIALGHAQLRIPIGIRNLSIPPRDFRQPGAPAANDSCFFRDSEPVVERPI
jgi:hypothetical protein